ncbi:MarR family transcriptional regulator [Crocinitomicaceae bacterium CZZ-1]|uniref:MarR family transcriptional regulator n=1 Tax=Taishania pollutisoli TaxID=2766479 RepID=A0A8J6PEG0_9FLAO|nr:MarR family transcriptional regulator [Taishania pollutisoli]MBC9813827.1 MarR family transcriptional regulator [Taishania pollutisoli]NGF77340.1 MarR family transcriptional regulator [Fluviicola sp. SGL-29]
MKIDDEIKAVFKSPQQKAVVNVRFTSNFLSNYQNSFMARFDISMPQFNILRILRGAKEALSVHTVKDRMIEKSPNTTRLMDKLIDKGLIDRIRCEEDRRVVYVSITEKGLELLAQIDVDFEKTSLFPQSLTDEEANTLSDLLDKIRSEFEEKE